MADTDKDVSQIGTEEEQPKPTPHLNPRAAGLKDIASRSDADAISDAGESVPEIDEEGNLIEAAQPSTLETSGAPPPSDADSAAEAEAEPSSASADEGLAPESSLVQAGQPPKPFDPSQEYEVEIDGVIMKVPGSKILDAGFRTFQKETAADLRLNLASRMLQEAEAKMKDTTPSGASPESSSAAASSPAGELSDLELAKALQLGTEEQAAEAISKLRSSGKAVSPEEVTAFVMKQMPAVVSDQIAFRDGVQFAQTEYEDILKNDSLRSLFFVEEERLRVNGDRRSYKDIYQTVGEKIRKEFKIPKKAPTKTTTVSGGNRQVAKATAPSVPATAAARMEAAPEQKPLTHEERLEKMRVARGQTALG